MDSIDKITASAQTATTVREKKDAGTQFSSILERMKNGMQNGAKSNEEEEDGSKSIIERSIIKGPDGSQMLVITQVTIKPNGQRSETKVLSRQKIAAPVEQKALESEEAARKKKAFEPEYNAQWKDAGISAIQQRYAQAGVTGLQRASELLSDLT